MRRISGRSAWVVVGAFFAFTGCDAVQGQSPASGAVEVTWAGEEPEAVEGAERGEKEAVKEGEGEPSVGSGASEGSLEDARSGGLAARDTTLTKAPRGIVQPAKLRSWPGSVVDGDTLRAVGFGKSIRLLNIDTDETFSDKERALAERLSARGGWVEYVEQKQKETQSRGRRFGNYGTYMGERARRFARDFFEGVKEIKVEYESPVRTRGFFDRHLAYVWVERGGEWLNYNVEAVRQGISPYYTKYGFSQLYHEAFVTAQEQAREARRGVWGPEARGYPDYEARTRYWTERAEQVQLFRDRWEGEEGFVDLAQNTAFADLRSNLGEEMVVFGEPTSLKERGQPQRMRMSYRYRRDFTVVAFDPYSLVGRRANPDDEHYIYVKGIVQMYRGDPQLRLYEGSYLRAGDDPPEP